MSKIYLHMWRKQSEAEGGNNPHPLSLWKKEIHLWVTGVSITFILAIMIGCALRQSHDYFSARTTVNPRLMLERSDINYIFASRKRQSSITNGLALPPLDPDAHFPPGTVIRNPAGRESKQTDLRARLEQAIKEHDESGE